ncbi:hypothetical protein TD95_002459 [Thielaviopsis punctulata]|uniref:Uncharacterized protein n=1 Tax=Thielaviopsis punctulata TaxID=72032 RepID=A0A0F4Z932_9PEZI|nr:hypothetical protein TD95_002459 [Thielaviopsis punctulata]
MLRHIVPVLRGGCSTVPRSLRRSTALASAVLTTRSAQAPTYVYDPSRSFHAAVALRQIHGPDDITEVPSEILQLDETAARTEEAPDNDNAANEDDLEVVREVIAPVDNSNKKNKRKSRRAEMRKQQHQAKMEKKAKNAASATAAGSIAHALGSASLAERLATKSLEPDATTEQADAETVPATADPTLISMDQIPEQSITEADSLKEGVAEVLKNVLEGQNIPATSLKKNKKKKKAGKDKKATEKKDDKDEKKDKEKDKKDKEKKDKKEKDKKDKAAKDAGKETKAKEESLSFKTLDSKKLVYQQVEQGEEVAKLCHGLERVLFNPGVYHLQDPRSGVYNFDPFLAKIMPVNEFDFRALKEYVTSSKDTNLANKARLYNKLYSGSTSSMTASLSQFHFLLSAWRPINASNMSRDFKAEPLTFTRITRAPSASFLHYNDGTYAMDADKGFDTPNILSMLGKSMEKLLTLPKEEYERYHRSQSAQITEEERNAEEAFSFATMGNFIIRSQLDANDKRLPGVGNFDLKTRAVVSIRMDTRKFKEASGYEIKGRYGNFESFEREYFDMIRSAFLKYSLQVRMGLMDGIFVAYHNTNRIFGFQYISLNEMDMAIHGTEDTTLGDSEFRLSLQMLNELLDIVTTKYPKQSLRLHIETRPTTPPVMYFFAKPVTPEEISAIQNANKEEIMRFENEMMAYEDDAVAKEPEEETAEETAEETPEQTQPVSETEEADEDEGAWSSETVWEEMTSKAEEAVESDELGLPYVRRAIQIALRQSGLLQTDATGEQGREYVEDLLETLTGTQVEDAEAETAEDAETPEAEPSTDETVQKAIETEEATDNARPEHPGQSSLKDLIRHFAEQAEPSSSTEQAEPSASASETTEPPNKLREFERILSALVEKNLATQATKSTEANNESNESVESADSSVPGSADADATTAAGTAASETPETPEPLEELTGLIVTIKNKVNGRYVTRPGELNPWSTWNVEYNIQEMDPLRAHRLYKQVQERRKKTLEKSVIDETSDSEYARAYTKMLMDYSKKGRRFRSVQDKRAREKPLYFLEPRNKDHELDWAEVFERSLNGDKKAPEAVQADTTMDESLRGVEGLVIEEEEDDNDEKKG